MQRPNTYPDWAINNGLEQISINGSIVNIPYRAEIPTAIKNEGLTFLQGAARQWINEQFGLIGEWVKHLDAQPFGVGSVYSLDSGTALPADVASLGTWTKIGQVGSFDLYRLDSLS